MKAVYPIVGMGAAVVMAGLLLVGCDPMWAFRDAEAVRVAALEDAAWDTSEWISVKDAPVADKATRKQGLSAAGTSCFRRQVANAKTVKSARWMTTGLGVYELYVNGARVGEDALKPGFTDGRKTKISYTYDVTALLDKGAGARNDFGAEVSSGWWRDHAAGYIGKKSAFRSVIELTYADGTTERIGTRAGEWFGAVGGPVKRAGIFDGEEYDARETSAARDPSGVFAPGGCERNDEFKGKIYPTDGAEIVWRDDCALDVAEAYAYRTDAYPLKDGKWGRVARTRTYSAGEKMRVEPGETLVVDFGQNCAGVPEFAFVAEPGTVLDFLPGEALNDADGEKDRGNDGPGGSVYRANYRQPDGMFLRYTFASDAVERYRPRYTFYGYRYAAIRATAPVVIRSLRTLPVTSIARESELGSIETGDKDVNRLIANVYWGQLSNYLSVPTDCPQRNERQGWTADTQVFTEAGSFNADTRRFFRKWMRDVVDAQHDSGAFTGVAPFGAYGDAGAMRYGWSDAGIIVPYQVWKQFGDRSIVENNWAAMERYMARANETKYAMAAIRQECGDYQWSDWLSYENLGRDGWDYLGGCYWMWDSQLMAQMARAIGKDAAKYDKMAADAKAYMRETFFKTDDGMIVAKFRHLQTPALFALKLGLVEGDAKAKTIAALKKNIDDHGGCLQTGFLGTSILMDTLTENGCADVAYALLLQHKNPSWLYSVDQGATTIWERWNSYTKDKGFGPVGMNSFNHYAYGAVLAWIYKTAAGIAADPAQPGFRNIVMKPVPDRRLGHVTASYKTPHGVVRSAWRYEGEKWIWDFTVPEGATATVTVPGEAQAKSYPAGTYRVER